MYIISLHEKKVYLQVIYRLRLRNNMKHFHVLSTSVLYKTLNYYYMYFVYITCFSVNKYKAL